MGKDFTKNYTVKGDHKVVATKGEQKDGTPQIVISCDIDGVKAELGLSYHTLDERDESFEKFTSDHALVAFLTIKNLFKK